MKQSKHDDEIWRERKKLCMGMLKELLENEFKGKIGNIILLMVDDIEAEKLGSLTKAEVYFKFRKNVSKIVVNKAYWGKTGFNEEELRNTLRHELLHLELMRGDDDPIFRQEAQKRGI